MENGGSGSSDQQVTKQSSSGTSLSRFLEEDSSKGGFLTLRCDEKAVPPQPSNLPAAQSHDKGEATLRKIQEEHARIDMLIKEIAKNHQLEAEVRKEILVLEGQLARVMHTSGLLSGLTEGMLDGGVGVAPPSPRVTEARDEKTENRDSEFQPIQKENIWMPGAQPTEASDFET